MTTYYLLDFETRSLASIKLGGRVYWADPTTEVVCCAWRSTDGGHGVWFPGDPNPFPADARLVAWNMMSFDRFGVERCGWPYAELIDAMQLSYRAGLPGGLDDFAAFRLGRRKDHAGSKTTMALSLSPVAKEVPEELKAPLREYAKACKAELAWVPIPQVALERVAQYCADDVEIMAEAWPELVDWLDVDAEVSRVERIVNDRGVPFDVELARRLLEEDARNQEEAIQEAAQGLTIDPEELRRMASSPAQFTAATGAENAQKGTIAELIRGGGDAALFAKARQALATIARGKLEAGLAREFGGRLYDVAKYYGGHTGRWSGQGMQLQNLNRPPPHLEDLTADQISDLAEAVIAGRRASPDEINVLLRATIYAPDGWRLVVCDFSAVENRALAFYAGDVAELDRIERKVDPYKTLAAEIYREPYESIGKGAKRSAGKIGVLACLAADTVVLTDVGWLPITQVLPSMRVWDGIQWVTTDGVIARGERATVEVSGVRMTPDHLVQVGDAWIAAGDLSPYTHALALATGSESLRSFLSTLARWVECAPSGSVADCADSSGLPGGATSKPEKLRVATNAPNENPGQLRSNIGATRTSAPMTSTGEGCSIGYAPPRVDARTPEIGPTPVTAAEGSDSSGAGTEPPLSRTSSRSPVGTAPGLNLTELIMILAMSPGICGSSIDLGTGGTSEQLRACKPSSISSEPVYDLVNAGPNNRFTIRTADGLMVVHNCGYGGGFRALENMAAANGVDFAEAGTTAQEVVTAWRRMHPEIVRFWYAVERAFAGAVRGQQSRVSAFGFCPAEDGSAVAIYLPSGRPVVYNQTELHRDGRRTQITYVGRDDKKSGGFRTIYTYGGKLVENIIQATCRDLMADKLVEVEDDPRAPVPIMHVHDEIVCLEKVGRAEAGLAYLERLMSTPPDWAEGFPLGADGYVSRRYKK